MLSRVRAAPDAAWSPAERLKQSPDWHEDFDRLLQQCGALLTVVSDESRKSVHCVWELERAIEVGVPIWAWFLEPLPWHPVLIAPSTHRVDLDTPPEQWWPRRISR